ncbi:ac76-like protein [Clanis bilineata nucleopolyhedrovirus]|uniref:Ac76-like protein n=1 Tax=Clanis bilineata nucleopolyhedrovirus TaxID=1307957 RepID=Q0N432_9ABAC|nr:ac76-like protein [Clanis bilineata nucleopolyhedrovirus]ABF47411.1 ac76-like protein [Clanis bilineata nucleopolyhedrovirus]
MTLFATFLVLILIGFLFDKNDGLLNVMLYLFMLFVVFIFLLQIYYIKPQSTTADLQTGKSKSIKKKRDLERAFDAILNKNTSSTD